MSKILVAAILFTHILTPKALKYIKKIYIYIYINKEKKNFLVIAF